MNIKTRALTLALAAGLFATACGGAADAADPDEWIDGPEVPIEAAEDTAAEDTSDSSTTTVLEATTTTQTPTTVAAATPKPVAPTTTEAAEPVAADTAEVASTPEFCAASADYYTATEAGDFVPRREIGAVRALFEEMETRLISATNAAPNDRLAEPTLVAQQHLAAVHDGIASVGYDGDAFEASQVFADLAIDFDGLAAVNGLLEQFLEGECGLTLPQLRVDGNILGQSLVERSAGGAPVTYSEVMDSAERIKLDLPDHWDDVVNLQGGDSATLVVAPNAALFDTSWAIDGIRISTAPSAGTNDLERAIAQSPAANECRLIATDQYDDGTYRGIMTSYRSCAGNNLATVISAESYDQAFTVLVELQFDNVDTSSDATTLETVIDTFLVR